jgi:(2S)-methylsuccinyl-CoA dehydrogenase
VDEPACEQWRRRRIELDPTEAIHSAEIILTAADALFSEVLTGARRQTDGGKALDEHQVLTERVAYIATELRAVRALVDHALLTQAAAVDDPLPGLVAFAYAADVAHRFRSQIEGALEMHAVTQEAVDRCLGDAALRAMIRAGLNEQLLADVGARVIESQGVNNGWIADEAAILTRQSIRAFARTEIAPLAEAIHRQDELVPEALLRKMGEMGLFAASIPEQYGGSGLGYLVMVITTEELSAASLAAGGSLSTRPEILARALQRGGTQEQREHWLLRIASGELLVAIAVTEPDVGSDVAAVSTRATPAVAGDQKGYVLNGTKAWSTFAGRADILAVLARTNPDRSLGARGLSLFIVPKQAHRGHDFEERQPGGGSLTGRAIATPGYRGMHSFILSFDDFFVPAANLVGEEQGLDQGFYLQLAGFAVGRLQTGGRATGLAQAALERTAQYVFQRQQFGRSIGEYGLTRYKLGRMAMAIAAARQLTYAAATEMEAAEQGASGAPSVRQADLLAGMAKLLASDVAVWTSQEGQLLHGGWGYAEETPISRYVVDAQVLPIFEGVKPVLELRVVGQALLRG